LSPAIRYQEDDMPRSWSDKRERQYEHIKDSYEERGRSEDKAEEIAARTVNKERSEAGETRSARKR
jgi:plasmid stabilization system protein ParE